MGAAFVAQTGYRAHMGVSVDAWTDLIAQLITRDDAFVAVSEDAQGVTGMIGGVVLAHPVMGVRTASELFWWVNPTARGRAGLRLLQAFEAWARAQGAAVVQMIAPTEAVGRLYARFGYVPVEMTYQRRLEE
jgi:hypothetical protein